MTHDALSDDIRRLIADHINSVEQLEVLLLLRGKANREWSAAEVAEEIRTSETSARSRLEDLAARGFLAQRRDGARDVYQYAPLSNTLRDQVDRLDHAYAERRFTVIDLIFSKPIDKLRLYADAFRFRRDDSDG